MIRLLPVCVCACGEVGDGVGVHLEPIHFWSQTNLRWPPLPADLKYIKNSYKSVSVKEIGLKFPAVEVQTDPQHILSSHIVWI